MSDLQEEDNKEAEKEESKGSVVTPTHSSLEGEIHKSGWEVNMSKQTEESVFFRVFCMDEERDWFKLDIKCPKKKFKRIGI